MLGDAQTGLCSTFLVYQVDGAAVDFWFLHSDGRAHRLSCFQFCQPVERFDDLLVRHAGADGNATQVGRKVCFVVLLNIFESDLFNRSRQAVARIAEGVLGTAHYRTHGAGRQALRGFAGLLQAFDGLLLDAVEVLFAKRRLEHALHH